MTRKIETRWISMQNSDAGYQGYLALPPAGKGPALVLFQEIFGVNGHIRAVAEQYAQDGFVVLAPDIFWRQAQKVDLGYEGADRERALSLMKGMKPEELEADCKAAVATLRALPEAAGQKVGAVGYCLGGRLAYLTAAWTGIDAAVSYYGGGIQDNLAAAAQIKGALQFHYAGNDHGIPMEAVEKVKAALASRAELYVYPGAEHGFNCWVRASYSPSSSALAHGRTLTFLAQHLYK